MGLINTIKENLIGAAIGGAVAYFLPQIVKMSIFIWGIPSGILSALGTIFTVILGALIGALIQYLIGQRRK